jgi:hypothetical protein
MYIKAIYRNTISMSSFYIENFFNWVKMAVYDAPMRLYLDIDLEVEKIKRENERLSRTGSRESSPE